MISIALVLFVCAIVVFLLGVVVGYFSWRIGKLQKQLDRVAAVLSQAGPEIAKRIQDGGTKVVLSDRWEEDEFESVQR